MCRKGVLVKTGVNEGGFWEPPNLPDRPLLYRLLTFSVKWVLPAWIERFRVLHLKSGGPMQYFNPPPPRPPLEHWLLHRRNVCKFYILKVWFPFAFCLFGCCCCCFLLFSVKR